MVFAERVEKQRLRGGTGLETLVDLTAVGLLILGPFFGVGFALTFTLWGFLAAGLAIAGGFLAWLLLRCLAEHLRLLKQISGLSFDGNITGQQKESIFVCSNCGQMLHADDYCEGCGAEIVSEPTDQYASC